MERKQFLMNSLKTLGLFTMASIPYACSKSATVLEDPETNTGTGGTGDCTVSPSETAGPFPTKSPSSLVSSDIVSDREGVPLTINLTVNDANTNCSALAGAIVDIWHCDAEGNYSEYGSTGMQQTNYTSVHFLRGRQTSSTAGLATFKSIFPGWYSGRAPHIHVHVYGSDGSSLVVTQIAFPTDVCDTVYTTATDFYTRGTQDTSNAQDNVFSDSLAKELATVTGSVQDGYTLTHLITVAV